MRNFLRQDNWDLDVVIGFFFATGFGIMWAEAGRDTFTAGPSYGLILLALAAFIVTNELGSLALRSTRYFPNWIWMPLVGALVFAAMVTITSMPNWMASHHRMEPRFGIFPRLIDFAFDAVPIMSIAFIVWAIPALIYAAAVRFVASLFTWVPSLRSIRIDPAQTIRGLTLFAATFFGSLWLCNAAH